MLPVSGKIKNGRQKMKKFFSFRFLAVLSIAGLQFVSTNPVAANPGPPDCVNQAVVANTYRVNLSGAQLIDSYDSALGAYGPGNQSNHAVVQAALDIENS